MPEPATSPAPNSEQFQSNPVEQSEYDAHSESNSELGSDAMVHSIQPSELQRQEGFAPVQAPEERNLEEKSPEASFDENPASNVVRAEETLNTNLGAQNDPAASRTAAQAFESVSAPSQSSQLSASAELNTYETDAIQNSPQNIQAEATSVSLDYHKKAEKDDDWFSLFNRLECHGLSKMLISHCEWLSKDSHVLRLRLDETQQALFDQRQERELEQIISKALNEAIELHIEVGALQKESPAQRIDREKREQRQANIDVFRNNVAFNELLNAFDATFDEKTVRAMSNQE